MDLSAIARLLRIGVVLCGFKEAILNTKELGVSLTRNDEGPKRIKANADILVEPQSPTTRTSAA